MDPDPTQLFILSKEEADPSLTWVFLTRRNEIFLTRREKIEKFGIFKGKFSKPRGG